MTGRIIYRPRPEHHCTPGVASLDDGYLTIPDGAPKGSVWQCECGRTWVSISDRGFGRWRAESKRERKKREATAPSDREPVSVHLPGIGEVEL